MAAVLLSRSGIALEPMSKLVEAATRLAIQLDHPAYDCCYLALAHAYDCDFVTADEVLARKTLSAHLPSRTIVLRDIGSE
jgi:predicted nucleic acid-binding protein